MLPPLSSFPPTHLPPSLPPSFPSLTPTCISPFPLPHFPSLVSLPCHRIVVCIDSGSSTQMITSYRPVVLYDHLPKLMVGMLLWSSPNHSPSPPLELPMATMQPPWDVDPERSGHVGTFTIMFSIHVNPVSCDDLDDALSVRWVCLASCHIRD